MPSITDKQAAIIGREIGEALAEELKPIIQQSVNERARDQAQAARALAHALGEELKGLLRRNNPRPMVYSRPLHGILAEALKSAARILRDDSQ